MTYADDKLFYWLSSPFVISRSPCKYLWRDKSASHDERDCRKTADFSL